MQSVQNILSDTEFNHELINRFFHTNSYFYRCLEKIIQQRKNNRNPSSKLFKELLDKLVDSDDKLEMISSLSKIAGFDQFVEKLNQGIGLLRDSDLDLEQMKIEIEKLAQNLFKCADKAFENTQAITAVEEMLSISKSDIEMIQYRESSYPEKNGPDVLTIDESQKIEETVVLTESPSHEPGTAKPELNLDSYEDTPVQKSEEKDVTFNQKDGTEAIDEGGCEFRIDEEGDSVSTTFSHRALSQPINSEPESVVTVFQKETQNQIEQIQQTIDSLKTDLKNAKQWRGCEDIFEKMAANAMVYGFDAFEQIAAKANVLVKVALIKLDILPATILDLLSEIKDVLQSILNSDVDRIEKKQVDRLLHKLQNPKKYFENVSLNPEENLNKYIKKNSRETTLTEGAAENGDSVALDEVQTPIDNENSERTPVNFTLPGEDDEEILSLVSEISNHYDVGNNCQTQAVQSDTVTASEFNLKKKPLKINEVESAKNGVTVVADQQLCLFKQQAEFYYSVIEEALTKLQSTPNDQNALEDLELASNSLYGLTLKLKLEPLSKFPAGIEELIGNVLTTNASLTTDDYRLIREVYANFKEFTCLEDSESRHCKELISSVNRLNSAISTRAMTKNKQENIFKITRNDMEGNLLIV